MCFLETSGHSTLASCYAKKVTPNLEMLIFRIMSTLTLASKLCHWALWKLPGKGLLKIRLADTKTEGAIHLIPCLTSLPFHHCLTYFCSPFWGSFFGIKCKTEWLPAQTVMNDPIGRHCWFLQDPMGLTAGASISFEDMTTAKLTKDGEIHYLEGSVLSRFREG